MMSIGFLKQVYPRNDLSKLPFIKAPACVIASLFVLSSFPARQTDANQIHLSLAFKKLFNNATDSFSKQDEREFKKALLSKICTTVSPADSFLFAEQSNPFNDDRDILIYDYTHHKTYFFQSKKLIIDTVSTKSIDPSLSALALYLAENSQERLTKLYNEIAPHPYDDADYLEISLLQKESEGRSVKFKYSSEQLLHFLNAQK